MINKSRGLLKMKTISIVCLLIIAPIASYATEWATINGVYLDMPATAVKKMGFTSCTQPDRQLKQPHFHIFDVETCKYVGDKMNNLFGEKVKQLEVGIYSGKVESITVETTHENGMAIFNEMRQKYGKPKFRKSGVDWERGHENIGLVYLDNGNCGIMFVSVANMPESRPEKTTRDATWDNTTKEIVRKARRLYSDLAVLREDTAFLRNGFGWQDNPTNSLSDEWSNRATELIKNCDAELNKLRFEDRVKSGLFNTCIAVNYINQMALHYALYSGQDDKSSLEQRKFVKSTLKIK
jgi:hypothetical protein